MDEPHAREEYNLPRRHADSPSHIHCHRAIIGFDEHGIPTVVHKADHQDENDPDAFIRDYNAAVAA